MRENWNNIFKTENMRTGIRRKRSRKDRPEKLYKEKCNWERPRKMKN